MEYGKSLNFKACENSCLNYKTILIQIELNYNSGASLYKYIFQKKIENSALEFRIYDINWYTNYEFSPVNVASDDIILISTNHSNTIFPFINQYYKTFDSYYNGYLFVSKTDNTKVKISYSDIKAKKEYDEDVGHMEVLKFNEGMSFEVINIDELFELKLYTFELIKSVEHYFYIKINGYEDYYILYETKENYPFLTIEKMPINIIKFSQSNIITDIMLMSYQNEYLLKVGNSKF